ncbi:MAG TPA: heparinase II/III family protein, partial [Armatimonadota bacterium]|nr:heparinase II/III family protein [Armatimonadota bacterium]
MKDRPPDSTSNDTTRELAPTASSESTLDKTLKPIEKLRRYYHTLRYLKPIQIYGRLWFRIYRPRPDVRPAPPLRPRTGAWQDPARRPASMTGPQDFHFLNRAGSLPPADGWNDPAHDRLWLYNLHYFDDFNASGASERKAWHEPLIERWIRENPPGSGNGWDPYPISLRVVNWIKWALIGSALSEEARHSLAIQTRYLAGRLEWLHLANHLFANLKALVFAGLYFGGVDGDRWLQMGLRLLKRQLREQILADGGHFERTPMYHSIILEDLLDLLNLTSSFGDTLPLEARPLQQQCRALIPDMLRWLKTMCHPDGEIAFFNDAAIGIAPAPAEIEAYAQ